jgi:hypothetical protein
MKERGVMHYEVDELDAAEVPDLPLEIQTRAHDGHQHTAMLDEYGDGFTDPVEDHYHIVDGGRVLSQKGHSHRVTGTFKNKPDQATTASPLGEVALAALNKTAKGLSMAGGRVEEADNHNHLVLILDTDSGFGQTSFDDGHSHWVLDWVVQEVDGHSHDLALRNLVEVSGIFYAIEGLLDEPAEEPAQEEGGGQSRPPARRNLDEGKTETFSEFGEPGVLKVSTSRRSSAADARELWENKNASILVTPVIPGLDLQAHIKTERGAPDVTLYVGNNDVTDSFRQIRESLKIINLPSDAEIVLTGLLTTRKDRDGAVKTLKGVLDGQTKDHVAAFYVEDCWWFDKSLKRASAFDRRRLVEQLLAKSTTPALKQMQRAFVPAGDEQKAARVTKRIKEEEGSIGVRWRDADAGFDSAIEEIIVG